jgi:hypothetical protein
LTLYDGYSADSYEFVLKYLYGYKFGGVDYAGLPMPRTLYEFAEIAEIAKEWDIAGFHELVTKAADRALVESLSREYKLQKFLSVTTWKFSKADYFYFDSGKEILVNNLPELNKTSTWPELLNARPKKLSVDINLAVTRRLYMKSQ